MFSHFDVIVLQTGVVEANQLWMIVERLAFLVRIGS